MSEGWGNYPRLLQVIIWQFNPLPAFTTAFSLLYWTICLIVIIAVVPHTDLLICLLSYPPPNACASIENHGASFYFHIKIFPLPFRKYSMLFFFTVIIFWDMVLGKHQRSNFIFLSKAPNYELVAGLNSHGFYCSCFFPHNHKYFTCLMLMIFISLRMSLIYLLLFNKTQVNLIKCLGEKVKLMFFPSVMYQVGLRKGVGKWYRSNSLLKNIV